MDFLQWLKREVKHLLPSFIFFFIVFNLINTTTGLMLKHEGIPPFSVGSIALGALIVAKALVLIDHLPFLNLFKKRPLIYNVLWKNLLYAIATLYLRFVIRVIPFMIESKGFVAGIKSFYHSVDMLTFWALQMWYVILFIVYVSSIDLFKAIGVAKVKQLFFGIKPK